MTGIAAALRDAEHLLWEEILGVSVLHFFFLSRRVSGQFTFGGWLPRHWRCFEFILQLLAIGHFLRAAVIIGTPGLVNWGVCAQGWPSRSYTKCPQGGSTFHVHLWFPGANRAWGQVGFLGCDIEWNLPEQTGKGLSLTAFPSKASHTTGTCRVIPSVSTVHCRGWLSARRQHSREEAWAGIHSTSRDWGQLNFAMKIPQGLWFILGLLSQTDEVHGRTLKGVQWSPDRLCLPHASSQLGPKPAQPPGMGQHPKSGDSPEYSRHHFLPFSLTSCQYYLQHRPFARVWFCQAQPPIQVLSHLWGYLYDLGGILCLRRSSRVVSIRSSCIF